MTQKSGYLIARTRKLSEFFTSSSSYDRPEWRNLCEATIYYSIEQAQNALTKILKNGLAFESRLISLAEATSFDFSNGETASGRGKFSSTPTGNQYPKGDQVTNPGSSDNSIDGGSNDVSDEMRADQEGEPCEECGHSPCTCETDGEGVCPHCGEKLNDGGEEPEAGLSDEIEGEHDQGLGEPEGNAEIVQNSPDGRERTMQLRGEQDEENAFSRAKFARGQMVNYRGAKHKVLADDGTGVAIIAPHGDDSHPIRVQNTALAQVSEAADLTINWREASTDKLKKVYDKLDKLGSKSASLVKAELESRKKPGNQVSEAEFKMPAKPLADGQPSENKTTAATYDAKIDKVKFQKPSMTDAHFDQGGDSHDEKVKVPAEVLSELKEVISRFAKEAEFSNTRDDAKASFLTTASEAMKTILSLLELGTVEGVKRAQISLQSMMSPIVNHVPVSVIKFISMGGKKPTLKDLFDVKRAAAKELE